MYPCVFVFFFWFLLGYMFFLFLFLVFKLFLQGTTFAVIFSGFLGFFRVGLLFWILFLPFWRVCIRFFENCGLQNEEFISKRLMVAYTRKPLETATIEKKHEKCRISIILYILQFRHNALIANVFHMFGNK